MKLKKYNDIFTIIDNLKEDSVIVDLSELSNRDSLRVLDFLCGITYFNGRLEKLASQKFKVTK